MEAFVKKHCLMDDLGSFEIQALNCFADGSTLIAKNDKVSPAVSLRSTYCVTNSTTNSKVARCISCSHEAVS